MDCPPTVVPTRLLGHLDTSPKKATILGHSETGGYESTIYIDSTTGWPRSLVTPHKGGSADFPSDCVRVSSLLMASRHQ